MPAILLKIRFLPTRNKYFGGGKINALLGGSIDKGLFIFDTGQPDPTEESTGEPRGHYRSLVNGLCKFEASVSNRRARLAYTSLCDRVRKDETDDDANDVTKPEPGGKIDDALEDDALGDHDRKPGTRKPGTARKGR